MTKQQLVGTWRLNSNLYKLDVDGKGRLTRENEKSDGWPLDWEWIDESNFVINVHVPGHGGSSHNPNGYVETSKMKIVDSVGSRLTVQPLQDEAGFDYDPLTFTKES